MTAEETSALLGPENGSTTKYGTDGHSPAPGDAAGANHESSAAGGGGDVEQQELEPNAKAYLTIVSACAQFWGVC
jgi:hypothetical protein